MHATLLSREIARFPSSAVVPTRSIVDMAKSDLDRYFAGKPDTYEIFRLVAARIEAAGADSMSVGKQISFGNDRKFAWVWLYNVTGRNPGGTLHLMLAIDRPIDDPHVRNVSQIGASRWNHQIVVRTTSDASSAWLNDLIVAAREYSVGRS